jgi:hypothetical protein
MLTGELFIIPQAVRQFQTRIAPWMTYEQALGAVIRELRDAKEFHPTENGKDRYVRTRGEWEFRAVIGEERASLQLSPSCAAVKARNGGIPPVMKRLDDPSSERCFGPREPEAPMIFPGGSRC